MYPSFWHLEYLGRLVWERGYWLSRGFLRVVCVVFSSGVCPLFNDQ